MSTFASLGLDPSLVTAVTGLGYEEPTPIQLEAIPILIDGRDLVGQAGTGTGKTAAFALPMLHRLLHSMRSPGHGCRALVLVPTRELAIQVSEAVHKYAAGTRLVVVPLYGGAAMDQQIRALRRGADIVVATPGRGLDHLRRGTLNVDGLETLVLDEADEMLDMGFAEDIEAIVGATPAERQTALFAATWAPRIAAIAGRHLTDPVRVTIAREKRAAGKLPRVRQVAYIVARPQKIVALGRVLEMETPKSAIVFCRTRLEVDELTETLAGRGYAAQALHGGMAQKQRDRVMQLFRKEQTAILVATDVAARGLDIDHVSHVINFDVPVAPEVYVHRIGRTGRIGREGVAITLASSREQRFLKSVEGLTKQRIDVKPLPTAADVQSRRLDVARETLRARVQAGSLEGARALVESLTPDLDLLDIAAAAVALMQKAAEGALDAADASSDAEPSAEAAGKGASGARGTRPPRVDRRAGRPPRERAVLRIAFGKRSGIRPGDLVGAITGEADVESSVLGAIRIAEDYATVEVPGTLARRIATALGRTNIRGRRVQVQVETPDPTDGGE